MAHAANPTVAPVDGQPKSLWKRLIARVFPASPDFFALLGEQCVLVAQSMDVFVRFMETGDEAFGIQVRKDEHDADVIKARNLHILNEAFSTPIDREDLYRAITDLDHVVNYCKTTVNEMNVLGVGPDAHMLEMTRRMQEGVAALVEGFSLLRSDPLDAFSRADAVRKSERRVEKLYRKALADLFQGDDYINMFKRREIYRHISNAADRLARAGNTLHDIAVKMS